MQSVRSVFFQSIEEDYGYFLYELDYKGYEKDIEGKYALDFILGHLESNNYTDIIIYAHGWNTGKNKDRKIEFANEVFKSMLQEKDAKSTPLFICIHWPSKPASDASHLSKAVFGLKEATKANSEIEENGKPRYTNHVKDLYQAVYSKRIDILDLHKCIERAIKTGLPLVSFNPLFAAIALKDVSFEHYIRRAHTVGSRGVHILIASLMRKTSCDVKIHLYGFSLGAHVVGAASIGAYPGSLLSRKIHSLTFFQGSMTRSCFTKGAAYRPLVSKLVPVAGLILVTYSENDFALKAMKFIQSKQLGYYGVNSDFEGDLEVVDVTLDGVVNEEYILERGKIFSIDCSNEIMDHNKDVGSSLFMRAFWKAATVDVSEEYYKIVEQKYLPERYWDSYGVRVEKKFINRLISLDIDGLR